MKRCIPFFILVFLLSSVPVSAQTYATPINVTVSRAVQNLNALPGEPAAFTFTAFLNEDGEANFNRYLLAFSQVETQLFGQPLLNMQTVSALVPEEYGPQRSAFSGQITGNGLVVNAAVLFVYRGTAFYIWTAMGYEADALGALFAVADKYTFRTNIGENPSEERVKRFVPGDDILPLGFAETSFTITDTNGSETSNTVPTESIADAPLVFNCAIATADTDFWNDVTAAMDGTDEIVTSGSFTPSEAIDSMTLWSELEDAARTRADLFDNDPIFVAVAEFAAGMQTFLKDGIETGQTDDTYFHEQVDAFQAVFEPFMDQCGSR